MSEPNPMDVGEAASRLEKNRESLASISVVIPVYNSAESLRTIVHELEKLNQTAPFRITEVIFVDDASKNPATFPAITRLSEEFNWVKGIKLSRNFGQYAATLCGFRYTSGDYVVTMDDDMQHHPADIATLFQKSGHDVVIGLRTNRKSSFTDLLTSQIRNYFDTFLLGKPKGVEMSAFRLMKRYVVDEVCAMHSIKPYMNALILYVTRDVCNVNIPHYSRMEGNSGYSLIKRLRIFSHLVFGNSTLLMRILRMIGVSIFLFSVLIAALLIVKKMFWGTSVTGWTSTMLAIIGFGSLQLVATSLIGEYLQRMFPQTESKKVFIIRDEVNTGKTPQR